MHGAENPLRHISRMMRYVIIMITFCLPLIDDSSLGIVVCLTLGVALVLWRPPGEIPVDCSVQPSTPTMHSSVMEKLEFSDTWQNINIFTRVPGFSESSAILLSRIKVCGSVP